MISFFVRHPTAGNLLMLFLLALGLIALPRIYNGKPFLTLLLNSLKYELSIRVQALKMWKKLSASE
jgi:hypothetical protein